MATVAMAPNGSSNDHSRTENNDREEERKEEEITKEPDSDVWFTYTVDDKIAMIVKIEKRKRKDISQASTQGYFKHAQVLQHKKTL
jgi:hypothetical protein